jgi:hypothetical protein
VIAPHGTYARYSNPDHPCRCEGCRAAKAAYVREKRAAARAAATASLIDERGRYVAPIDHHGTQYGYQEASCRCLECTHRHAVVQKRQYAARRADLGATA